MIAADFEAFKDWILAKNTYFDNGIANAFKFADNGLIMSRNDKFEAKPVFPNDRLGNYFYLRDERNMTFKENYGARLEDCGAGRLGFDDNTTVALVAVMKNADEYKLLKNLRNTAMWYSGLNIIPTSAVLLREKVIQEELTGAEDKEINKALQNLKDWTIIKVVLSVNDLYVTNTCIEDVCKNC